MVQTKIQVNTKPKKTTANPVTRRAVETPSPVTPVRKRPASTPVATTPKRQPSSSARSLPTKKVYPMALSILFLIGAVLLSFTDLMLLNDVIARILDQELTTAMPFSFVLSLIGLAVMGHHGIKIAHGTTRTWSTIGYYTLWLALGVTLAVLRVVSAKILGLDAAEDGLTNVFGLDIRSVDIIVAPLMVLLYIASGLLAKDGAKNLILSPDLEKWSTERRKNKLAKKIEDEQRRIAAIKDRGQQAEAAADAKEAARLEAIRVKDEARQNKIYDAALKEYNAKLEEIKTNYRKVSSNLDYVKSIDKQEAQFESTVKPSLMKIVQGSIDSTMSSAALAVRAKSKTGIDPRELQDAIHAHTAERR